MVLPSLASLVDPSSEQGRALLAAAASAKGTGSKRQKSMSLSGMLGAGAGCPSSAAAGTSVASAQACLAQARALTGTEAHHECLTLCGSRTCHAHNRSSESPQPADDAAASLQAAAAIAQTAGDAVTGSEPGPHGGVGASIALARMPTGCSAAASLPPLVAAGTEDEASVDVAECAAATGIARQHPNEPSARGEPAPAPDGVAGPGPSSLRGVLRQSTPISNAVPLSSPEPEATPASQPLPPSGLQLPEGWSFRPEWRQRPDPGPAALREVLRLPPASRCTAPVAAACSRAGGGGERAGIVCALEFSPDGLLLAAGGVDKQIRLYNLSEVLGAHDCDDRDPDRDGADSSDGGEDLPPWAQGGQGQGHGSRHTDDVDEQDDEGLAAGPGPAVVHRMPSKISSMAWSPFQDGVLTVGDYDGVLLQLHIASGHQLADVEAHEGRKVWSVAHSATQPHLLASAADDRCARLWAGRGLETCAAVLQPNPRASVCGVDFCPDDDHLLALACSDRTAYLYDTRQLGRGPLAALRHHTRPASYVRFLGPRRLVTAATDASLALWDLRHAAPCLAATVSQAPVVAPVVSAPCVPAQSPFLAIQQRPAPAPAGPSGCSVSGAVSVAEASEPFRVFRGHRNEKNFVGLSVRARDGLLACGSECSRAFAYHTSWSDPLATLDLTGPRGAGAAHGAAMQAVPHMAGGALRHATGGSDGAGFVSAVCWQPAEAAVPLGLPPLLASATSLGTVSLSVLAAAQ